MTNPIVERLRERASRIAFIWRATNSTDKPSEDAVLMMDAAAEIERLSAELERARVNLDGRDKFIVDRGLWPDFVKALPRPKINGGNR